MQLLTLLALVVPAVAFVAAPGKPSSMALAAEKSKSLPFLDRPAKVSYTSKSATLIILLKLHF